MEIQKINISEQAIRLVSEFMDEEYPVEIDFNWLMPVVEKIESIETEQDGHFGVFISSNTCMIQGTKLYLALKAPKTYGFVYMSDPNAVFPTKLESTWYNVVEFIKWYNKKEICNICHGKTSCSCEDTNITPGG